MALLDRSAAFMVHIYTFTHTHEDMIQVFLLHITSRCSVALFDSQSSTDAIGSKSNNIRQTFREMKSRNNSISDKFLDGNKNTI